MDKSMIEKYKNELLKMHKSTNAQVRAEVPKSDPVPTDTTAKSNTEGALIGIVTAVRALYPVKNAKVTIFTGSVDNMNIIDSDLTDISGRTKTFILQTPERALSLEETNTTLPYAEYNMMVEADGYIKNIHLNIPVFGTVTSLQQSNLLLSETAGIDKEAQIFDESENYDL